MLCSPFRALSLFCLQVKELGVVVYNCTCLAQDLSKMFEVYWALGVPNATIPSPWPERFSTTYNKESPLGLTLNGTEARVYLSVSGPVRCRSTLKGGGYIKGSLPGQVSPVRSKA